MGSYHLSKLELFGSEKQIESFITNNRTHEEFFSMISDTEPEFGLMEVENNWEKTYDGVYEIWFRNKDVSPHYWLIQRAGKYPLVNFNLRTLYDEDYMPYMETNVRHGKASFTELMDPKKVLVVLEDVIKAAEEAAEDVELEVGLGKEEVALTLRSYADNVVCKNYVELLVAYYEWETIEEVAEDLTDLVSELKEAV